MACCTHNLKVLLLLLLVSSVLFQSSNSNGVEATPPETSPVPSPAKRLLQPHDNTIRIDPLNNLKIYRGGFDVTNKHYWSSALFTAIYGCVIAVLWLLCGLIFGGFKIMTVYKTRFISHNRSILVAAFFTVLVIVCTGLILGGSLQFLSRAKTVVNEINEVVNAASGNIYNTTGAMRDVRTNLTRVRYVNPRAYRFLASTSQMLDSRAAQVQQKVKNTLGPIHKGLKITQPLTIFTLSVNLVAVICLSVFGVLRMRRAFRGSLALCWFLVIIWWLLFGAYFALDKIEGDTCTALQDFQRDPTDNIMSSLVPCKELFVADSALCEFSKGVHKLVNMVNRRIRKSYGNFVQICNPFSGPPEHHYQPEKCLGNTKTIGWVAHALRIISCPDSTDGKCLGGVYIHPMVFYTVVGFLNSIQSLLQVYPDMKNLAECQPMKDVFSEILNRHCKPLKKYTRMVWVSAVVLAITTMLLLLIWIVEDWNEEEHRFSDGATEIDLMEAGLRKEDKRGSKS